MAYISHIAHQEHLTDAATPAADQARSFAAQAAPQQACYRHLNARVMLMLRTLALGVDLGALLVPGYLVLRAAWGVSDQMLAALWLATALFVPLFYACGLGQRATLQVARTAVLRPVLAMGMTFAGVAAMQLVEGRDIVLWAAASLSTSLILRLVLVRFLNHHPRTAQWQESIAFLGHARDIAEIFAHLPTASQLPVNITGYYSISPQPEVALSGLTHLGSIQNQAYLLLNQPLDRLIVVTRDIDAEYLNTLMHKLAALACPVDVCLLPLIGVPPAGPTDRRPISSINALLQRCRLIPLQHAPMTIKRRAVKRLFDITASALAIVALSPVLAGTALAVRYSSPGPILFRQPRWGRSGQTFHILKFRSMYTHACDSGRGSVQQATREDPRITPVGRFLRRTSLDELPQLFNVLRGDMSLIGPRPHAVAHNELYAGQVRGYVARHRAKPGLSGWAQVHGCRGETPQLQMMQKRIDYDADYSASRID